MARETATGRTAAPTSRTASATGKTAASTRRLPRAERREQILAAATRAFARGGYGATGLDDVAAEAGVTHVIVYRHFASKSELYRAVLDRACRHLDETVGTGDFGDDAIPALLGAAAADPDGFRLLFRYAAREPEFADVIDQIRSSGTQIAEKSLSDDIPAGPWRDWAARFVPTLALEAVIAWLDAGQPDPDQAARRISSAIDAAIQAAR